jgi:hypothetical protein
MTQPVIQKFNENSYMSMPAKPTAKAVHPNCKLLAQAVQLNRRNPADHHSPCADCGLGTRGLGRSLWRHICILQNCNKKVQVRKKNMEKT